MKFKQNLIEARFLKRYKRFFADVVIDGKTEVALVPNTGSLKTCLFENAKCYVSFDDNPKRKLKYTLELLETPTGLVGVNTNHPNTMVLELYESKKNESWKAYVGAKREFKISKESRLDMILWDKKWKSEEPPVMTDLAKNKFHLVEVKNTTYAEDGVAKFPDAVTTRGQKHLKDLMSLVKKGHKAELVFAIQRENIKSFGPADHIDPEYGKLLREAKKKGVIITPILCKIGPSGLEMDPSRIIPTEF